MDHHSITTNDQPRDDVDSVAPNVDPIRDTDDVSTMNDPVPDQHLSTDRTSPSSAPAINSIAGHQSGAASSDVTPSFTQPSPPTNLFGSPLRPTLSNVPLVDALRIPQLHDQSQASASTPLRSSQSQSSAQRRPGPPPTATGPVPPPSPAISAASGTGRPGSNDIWLGTTPDRFETHHQRTGQA